MARGVYGVIQHRLERSWKRGVEMKQTSRLSVLGDRFAQSLPCTLGAITRSTAPHPVASVSNPVRTLQPLPGPPLARTDQLPHMGPPCHPTRPAQVSTLHDNTTITSLDVSGNRMGPHGSKALAELLVSRVGGTWAGVAGGSRVGGTWLE